MIFTFRLSNSGLIFAMYPSSVVHTGVKSLGCENSTAHESPIQSWKRMRPSVVSASKSGAVSPSCTAIVRLLVDTGFAREESAAAASREYARLRIFDPDDSVRGAR